MRHPLLHRQRPTAEGRERLGQGSLPLSAQRSVLLGKGADATERGAPEGCCGKAAIKKPEVKFLNLHSG